jgi:hypothetical protein
MSDIKHKKWSSSDELILLKLISENNPIDKISKKLKKKEKEILYKLKKIAQKMCNEHKSKDEIKKNLKILTDEQINKIIEHVNKKKSNKNITIDHSDEFSEIGINKNHKLKKKNINNKNILLDDSNNIISLLNEINKKLDFIINSENKNNIERIKKQANISSDTENESSETQSVVNKKEKSNSSDLGTSGDDTDDIINMINRGRGIGAK